ncbi:MAG: hypothetical protein QXO97_05305 [Candidatus Nezhaarchaeales archaeon]
MSNKADENLRSKNPSALAVESVDFPGFLPLLGLPRFLFYPLDGLRWRRCSQRVAYPSQYSEDERGV